MKNYKLLFPSQPFEKGKVDSNYMIESNIATVANFDYYIFDYEYFISDNKLIHNIKLDEECKLIYRGWMLKPEQYKELNNKIILKSGGKIELINTPLQYENCHCFPNAYPLFIDYTPDIRVLERYEKDSDFEGLINNLPWDFFIKDFVKSIKNDKGVERLSKDISLKDFKDKVMDFIEERGKLFTGGIVLKEFIKLKDYDGFTNEWRAFCFNGKVISLVQNSGLHTKNCPPEPFVKAACETLADKSRFFTVDFAEMDNDIWIILETGDGQVSGFPEDKTLDTLSFYNKMKQNESIFRL